MTSNQRKFVSLKVHQELNKKKTNKKRNPPLVPSGREAFFTVSALKDRAAVALPAAFCFLKYLMFSLYERGTSADRQQHKMSTLKADPDGLFFCCEWT